MPKQAVEMSVELADGTTRMVVVDQRDLAAAEGAGIGRERLHTWLRYTAWNALRRNGYSGTWDHFNTLDAVEVIDQRVLGEEGPAGDEDGLDPGRKAARAGKGSRSR